MKANTSKLMKSLLQNGVYGVAAVAAIGVTGDALAQITGTRHNLSTTGTGSNHVTTGTGEICVFCHTPHGGDVSTAGAPLWNRRLPTTTTYTLYSSSTLDDTANQPGGVSLACLSCHDGAQAMDVMINQPGSGGYNTSGADAGYTWTGSQNPTGAALLGTDLSNDHPIGIIYCGGTWLATAASATCGDADFRAPTKVSNTNWYVSSGTQGTSGSKDKTDMQLYYNAAATEMRVECGSCHDPHVAAKATNQTAFLRVTQAGSALCLTCHSK